MGWLEGIRAWFMSIWSSIPQDFKDRMADALWAAVEAAVREFYRSRTGSKAKEDSPHENA